VFRGKYGRCKFDKKWQRNNERKMEWTRARIAGDVHMYRSNRTGQRESDLRFPPHCPHCPGRKINTSRARGSIAQRKNNARTTPEAAF